MDDILFIVAIVAFFILQSISARKKKQQQLARQQADQQTGQQSEQLSGQSPGQLSNQAGSAPAESAPRPEFDEALAEIRAALGMGSAAPRPAPDRAQPATVAQEADFHSVDTGRRDEEAFFESSSPYHEAAANRDQAFASVPAYSEAPSVSENLFERAKLGAFSGREDAFEAKIGEFSDPLKGHHHRDSGLMADSATPAERSRYQIRSLREAIVNAAIIGPPRAKTGPIRKR